MRDRPLADVPDWTRFYAQMQLPALRRTVVDLADLRAREDRTTARGIALTVLRDPFARHCCSPR